MNAHKIWIAQILCPSRHCIMGMAFDAAETNPVQAKARLVAAAEQLVVDGTIDRECVICESRAWSVEAGPTQWTTMEAARPHIDQCERENAATRRFFMAMKGIMG
jgi:hypothetical protein